MTTARLLAVAVDPASCRRCLQKECCDRVENGETRGTVNLHHPRRGAELHLCGSSGITRKGVVTARSAGAKGRANADCFDNIDHHRLMQRVREHCADLQVNRLLVQFLKAGVLSEEHFLRTDAGTPQGGIISPPLANIALGLIEERYERWVEHRTKRRAHRKSDGLKAALEARSSDRRAGRVVMFTVRYADDFVILVHGTQQQA
jgi:Reverse transcriptase (RNA-dependent DNA polymerase)